MCWPFVDVWLEDPPRTKKKKKKKNRPEAENRVWIYVSASPRSACLFPSALGYRSGSVSAPLQDVISPPRLGLSGLEQSTDTREKKILTLATITHLPTPFIT